MKRVTIDIPDRYADAMTIILIGGVGKPELYINHYSKDLTKGDVFHFCVNLDGKITQEED